MTAAWRKNKCQLTLASQRMVTRLECCHKHNKSPRVDAFRHVERDKTRRIKSCSMKGVAVRALLPTRTLWLTEAFFEGLVLDVDGVQYGPPELAQFTEGVRPYHSRTGRAFVSSCSPPRNTSYVSLGTDSASDVVADWVGRVRVGPQCHDSDRVDSPSFRSLCDGTRGAAAMRLL